jgi:uncharacterized integral membrane protein
MLETITVALRLLNCEFYSFQSCMIYLLTAIGLTPGGSSTVHIYTQTIHRTTQHFWKHCGTEGVIYQGIMKYICINR